MSEHPENSRLDLLKSTLNLPRTDFPIRPNAKIDDPALIQRWEQEKLYTATFTHNTGNATYILHDGPPYANGSIHLGHAYNKILKDIITKAHRMAGYHTPVTPGWDCHGLPIEFKVAQDNPGLSPLETKTACRKYAQKWIDVQREEFKRLGVLMNWAHPYITMDFAYEATTVRAFGKFLHDGFIERKNKTVPWCPSCSTSLATAEIEYQERKDPSIYVTFPLAESASKNIFHHLTDKKISFLVWTTTPWTLPLNRAVAVKPNAQYHLIDIGTQYLIVGAQLSEKIAQMLEVQHTVVQEFSSKHLEGVQAHHPFVEQLIVPIIFDDFVGLTDGTACVHTAPGCGPTDYELGIKNNLEIYSPISANGEYTDAIQPVELTGMKVSDGQIWVIKKLAERGMMLHKTSLRHSYPHCWRCRNGLIFRATPQWFFDLKNHDMQKRALTAIETLNCIPESGRKSFSATIGNRWEWCLSRQRAWGTPIPALLCNNCDYTYTTTDLVEQAAQGIAQEGVEFWDRVPVSELIPHNFACPSCKATDSFRKEFDILDVWFDSGVSHYAVLYNNPALSFPADLYLEGVDQYRGWFQSSLLTSLGLEHTPAMKTIMTHGYTVDDKGQKMSKSLGNGVEPQEIIDRLGTDGLRLWVASIGHASDVVVSNALLSNVSEVFRKIRNTCRFLLQNLYDFDKEKDALTYTKLLYIDQQALISLTAFNERIQQEYLKANFTIVFHELADYCAGQLSSFYLDVIKDRLYVEAAQGHKRRSAQTVIWYILDTLTRLTAPIMSFTAEQLTDHYQTSKTESVHLQSFAQLLPIIDPAHPRTAGNTSLTTLQQRLTTIKQADWFKDYEEQNRALQGIRDVVLKSIELQRAQGLIKHPLEAQVTMYISPESKYAPGFNRFVEQLQKTRESLIETLKDLCIVSHVTVVQSADLIASPTIIDGIYAQATTADGVKCPRCWRFEITNNADNVCHRCAEIVKEVMG